MKRNKILVFIPIYNCENQILRVLNQFTRDVSKNIDEILLVNNQSTDNSEQVALAYMKEINFCKITMLRNIDNYGLGGSHKAAIDYGLEHNFSHIIVLHGDDQGNINDIIPLINEKMHEKFDCLLGARFHSNSILEGYSWIRTIGNRAYNLLFSAVCKKRIYDLGSGLNCYNINIFKNNFHRKYPDDLTFNYCMILGSAYYKHSIYFFPLTWREDDQVSNVKLVRQAFKVLSLLGAYAVNRKGFLLRDLRDKQVQQYASIQCGKSGMKEESLNI